MYAIMERNPSACIKKIPTYSLGKPKCVNLFTG